MPGILTVYLGKYRGWSVMVDISLGVVVELQAIAPDGQRLYGGPNNLEGLLKAIDGMEARREAETSE